MRTMTKPIESVVRCSGNQCKVLCAEDGACTAGVETFAGANLVECTGKSTCRQKLSCSGATCPIPRAGPPSCEDGASCFAANCL